MAEIPPDLTARADQIRAKCSEDLDTAVQLYRAMIADRDVVDPNITWGYLVGSISHMMTTPSGERDVIFTLAAAIERLSR